MENFAVNTLSDDVIKALCTTLLHSLWQGLILAAFAGLVVTCTRKLTPAKRYNLLIAGLVVFATATICTFITQLNRVHDHTNVPVAFQTHTGNILTSIKTDQPVAHRSTVTNMAIGYMNKHAYTIVLVWFLIVFARSLQLLTGLHGLYHLRRKAMFTIDGDWEKQVKVMADKMGIQRIVGIAESGIAKVPMVIGHLKPLILLPIGLITAMPPAEIEAILVHELAHIRRRDYLVNLLQSLLEIVFFFNPAVLWLSALIRAERENCCDDIAIAQTSNKVNYIRALVTCQEYRLSAPAYAMAIKGKQNHLLARVKRLASGSNQSLNVMEKSLLAVCLIGAGLLTAAFSNAEKIDKLMAAHAKNVKKEIRLKRGDFKLNKTSLNLLAVSNPLKNGGPILTDTLKAKKLRKSQLQKHVSNNRKLDRLVQKLDSGKREKALQQQKLAYDRQKSDRQAQKLDSGKRELALQAQKVDLDKQKEEYRLQQIAYNKQKEQYLLKQDAYNKQKEQYRVQKLESDKQKEASRLQKIESDKQKEQSRLQRLNALKAKATSDSLNQLYKKSAKPATQARSAIPANSAAFASPAGSASAAVPARSARTADYKPYVAASSKTNADHDLIMAEMVNDGIIKKEDNALSFKLSEKEFIVNGKKQPDDVYQKYRAEYVKVTGHNGYTWYYNYDTPAKKTREEKTTVTIN
ncbi:MAG: family metallopeptidase [Mucilaginibacter sp.]|nr:family metallopeptidase [Mucilaginibacter sp.]